MATFDEFYNSLNTDSNVRGYEFEKIFVPWFLKTDPLWANQIDGVWLWDDYPKRSEWGPDNGVDIILHHANGERWAVQAKCFSPNNYLSKEELNSFIADSSDDRFQEKLLISSTNKIGPNADRLLTRHKVIRFLLKDLRDSDINFPISIEKLNEVIPVKKFDPKPHQLNAINNVLNGLNDANKGQVLMACGSGKTLTALWIKERLSPENTLVLLPSLSLLRQTVKNWNTHQRKIFKWLCICSDKTVAKDKKNKDQWISNTSELGISVTSDLLKIKEFLSLAGNKVIFSTYQSSDLICELQKVMPNFTFDLTIADEAHNCTGRVETYFGNILDDKKIKTVRKLFFTATPKILSKTIKKASIDKEIEVASMDEESKFGKVLHRLKFSEAIKTGILSDYQVSIVGVDNEEILKMIRLRDLVKAYEGFNFDSESLGTLIAVIKSIRNYKLRKLISFHNLIDHANIFSQIFPLVSKFFLRDYEEKLVFTADYVDGKMKATEKDEKIQKLNSLEEDTCFVLSNARCLSEGVDVPTLDGVAFIDPKHSPIDIVQAVGRAIRKSHGKTKGTIIIPVFLGEIENLNEQILASKFSTVWSVITALKSQDDELLEKIDNLRIQLGSRKITKITSRGFEKIHFDLPENVNPKFYDSLYTVLIENTSDDWYERYGELKRFLSENDNRYPTIDEECGQWAHNQRMRFKKNKLLKERCDLLLELKDWSWDLLDSRWSKEFEKLKEFIKKNGKIPRQDGKGYNSLANWVSNQRSRYRNGRLEKNRFQLLDSLDAWEWEPFDERFETKFEKLKIYLKENDNNFPPSRTKVIGPFISRLRKEYVAGILDENKVNIMNSLNGWSWDPLGDAWMEKYEGIKKYWEDNDHKLPSTVDPEFGEWINTNRSSFKNKTLDEDKVKLLEKLTDWEWTAKDLDGMWMERYEELLSYIKKHKKLPQGRSLSITSWLYKQRKEELEGTLTQERYDLLDKLGFSWGVQNTKRWNQRYRELNEFLRKNKGLYPVHNSVLGRWVAHQKEYRNNDKLIDSRISQLEKLPNWNWWKK